MHVQNIKNNYNTHRGVPSFVQFKSQALYLKFKIHHLPVSLLQLISFFNWNRCRKGNQYGITAHSWNPPLYLISLYVTLLRQNSKCDWISMTILCSVICLMYALCGLVRVLYIPFCCFFCWWDAVLYSSSGVFPKSINKNCSLRQQLWFMIPTMQPQELNNTRARCWQCL